MSATQRSKASGPLQAALRACKTHFVAAAIFSALANLLYLAPTIYMIQVYDRAVPTGGLMTLAGLTMVVAVSLAVLSALEWLRSRVLVRAGARLDRLLAPSLLSALLSIQSLTPAARSQTMREFDSFRQVLAGPGLLAAMDAPWVPIYLLTACLLNPWLGLAGLVSAILMVGLAWLNEKATKEPLQKANDAAGAAYAAQDYSSSSAGAVNALGMRSAMVAHHLAGRQSMTGLQVRASFSASGYLSLIKGFRLIVQSLALGLGAWLVIAGKMSPGAIFAASFLLARVLAPVEQGVGAWKSIVLARGAFAKLTTVLSLQASRARAHTTLPAPKGELRLEGVYVSGGQGRPALLADINFKVAAGETVGVIGPSGAGKSTLARIIAGAAAPDTGVVRIDGAAAADWDSDKLGRHVGYVPQDFILFPGTVKENISRFQTFVEGQSERLDEMAIVAARAIGAHEMILRLPQGYDTIVGLGGAGLSAGQAQRIAIARALYGEPHILVMDEPNAHLDTDGEMALVEALADRKAKGCVSIVVAHRDNILANADNVLLLRSGRIDLFGTLSDVAQRMRSAIADRTSSAPVPASAERRMKA